MLAKGVLGSHWLLLLFLFPQTYLEQTKTQFNKNYKAMHPSKITTTVGLNSKYMVTIH